MAGLTADFVADVTADAMFDFVVADFSLPMACLLSLIAVSPWLAEPAGLSASVFRLSGSGSWFDGAGDRAILPPRVYLRRARESFWPPTILSVSSAATCSRSSCRAF
jgi:hypothetical protein